MAALPGSYHCNCFSPPSPSPFTENCHLASAPGAPKLEAHVSCQPPVVAKAAPAFVAVPPGEAGSAVADVLGDLRAAPAPSGVTAAPACSEPLGTAQAASRRGSASRAAAREWH